MRKVALDDASAGFRLTALLWLTVALWDLASPTIRHIADHDSSPEVREKAKEILRQRNSGERVIIELHLRNIETQIKEMRRSRAEAQRNIS